MRTFSAILLLAVFSFAQYARQLSYLECKFSNLFKPDTLKCDCEKKAGFDPREADPEPVSQHHNHLHLDEFFLDRPGLIIDGSSTIPLSLLHPFLNTDHLPGYYSPPWRPPIA